MQNCVVCGIEFKPRDHRQKSCGREPCKAEVHAQAKRNWEHNNQERKTEVTREWRAANPDEWKAIHDKAQQKSRGK